MGRAMGICKQFCYMLIAHAVLRDACNVLPVHQRPCTTACRSLVAAVPHCCFLYIKKACEGLQSQTQSKIHRANGNCRMGQPYITN